MSTDNFTFFTPEQLREARKHAVDVNKERYNALFKQVTEEVQEEIKLETDLKVSL